MGEQQLEILARAADGIDIPTSLNPEKDGVVLPDHFHFWQAYAEAARILIEAEADGGDVAANASKEFKETNFEIIPIEGAILVKVNPNPVPYKTEQESHAATPERAIGV